MAGDRPELEAVLFDAGGTLVRIDFEWIAGTLLADLGHTTDVATLRRAEVEGRRRYDHSVRGANGGAPLGGPGNIHAYFGGMLAACGAPVQVVEAAVPAILAREKSAGLWTRPMEGARDAVAAVAALGLRRAVVSNSDGRAEWHLRHAGVHDGIEFVIDSGLVGVEKPDPRIFRLALERLAVEPGRALYVGDLRTVDHAGAREAGMHCVLLDPHGDYGGPGIATIPGIDDLPRWIVAHFIVRTVTLHPESGG